MQEITEFVSENFIDEDEGMNSVSLDKRLRMNQFQPLKHPVNNVE